MKSIPISIKSNKWLSDLFFIWVCLSLPLTQYSQTVLSNPSSCGLNASIPDQNCLPNQTIYQPEAFEIQVNNAPGTAMGVDVFLKSVEIIVGHTWLNDLTLTLVSPAGISVELVTNTGGNEDNFGDPTDPLCLSFTDFDIGSCIPITDGTAPFTGGPYQPQENFYIFNDGFSNPNQTWLLLICDDSADDVGTLEYVNLVFEPLSCLPIADVQLIEQDTNAIFLGWTPSNLCGITIIDFGPTGYTPGIDSFSIGGNTQIIDGCPNVHIENLLSDTEYDLYVRRYCEETGSFSANSCPISFRTSCEPANSFLSENFDDAAECLEDCTEPCPLINSLWQNVSFDDMDWISHSGNTITPGTGPSNDISGTGKYIYIETSSCDENDIAYLYSPCLTVDKQGTDTCHISFNYHMYGLSTGSLEIEYSLNGGFDWLTLWSQHGQSGNQWNKVFLDFNGIANGQEMILRFKATKGNGSQGDIALDEILLYGAFPNGHILQTYYRDQDHDSYGSDNVYLRGCTDETPSGYSLFGGDCNDNNENIHPGAQEIFCNGEDENCNADLIDDDQMIPAPLTTGDTICAGETALLCAIPVFQDSTIILWYDAPFGNIVGFGNCFTPFNLPENNTALPMNVKYYAAQSWNYVCYPEPFYEVIVTILPKPAPYLAENPSICPGDSIDLSRINIEDQHFTGATIGFYNQLPVAPQHLIGETILYPTGSQKYYYQMVSPDGCSAIDSLNVIVKTGPLIDFLPSDSISLCGENTATITVNAFGSVPPYTYFWNTGDTIAFIDVMTSQEAGQTDYYSVNVEDGEGCSVTDTVSVTTTNSIDSVKTWIDNVSICNGNDGRISILPLNGLAPFSAEWSNVDGMTGEMTNLADTIHLTNLPQGVYNIYITDASTSMCTFELRSIIVQGPNAVISTPEIEPINCFGEDNGSICVDVIGGAPSYIWNTGDTTSCIEQLAPGRYDLTITVGACTTVIDSMIITEPEIIGYKALPFPPSCSAEDDGAIELLVFGGTPPYTFYWENGRITQNIYHIPAGEYPFSITDDNGCVVSDTVYLLGPAPLMAQVDSFSHVSCNGMQDGFIQISGTGGTEPYSYLWENNQQSPVRYGLSPGTYSLTITDANNCSSSHSYTINNPAPLHIALINTTAPVCNGDSTGQINLGIFGGTPPYSIYDLEGHEYSTSISNMPVGQYQYYVQDSRACTSDTLDVSLTATASIDMGLSITAPECVGPPSGSIQLNPVGASPFRYEWYNGDTTSFQNNLTTGTYPVQITDNEGCIYDTSIVISAPQVFDYELIQSDPSCHGLNDGSIVPTFIATGTPPFEFTWSDDSHETQRNNISAGMYALTVSDALGCTLSDSTLLEEPLALDIDIIGSSEILCHGDSTVYFETNVLGGVAPYTYNWIGTGIMEPNISGLAAGSYTLSIRDANLCPKDTVLVVDQPSLLEANYTISQGEVCEPLQNDSIIIDVTGGSGKYTSVWNTADTGLVLTHITPGNYSISITDENACKIELEDIKLRERVAPIQLDSFYLDGPFCFGDQGVTMTAKISGGSEHYYYTFNPTLEWGPNADDSVSVFVPQISPTYSVTVTDIETGCQVQSDVLQAQSPELLFASIDSVQLTTCYGSEEGAIFIHVQGGTAPYSFIWKDSLFQEIAYVEDVNGLSAGVYHLELTDNNGCTFGLIDSSLLQVSDPIQLDTAIITDVACKGEATGAIDIAITGGEAPYDFHWDYEERNEEDLAGIEAGIYKVIVEDIHSCSTDTLIFEVNEPPTILTLEEIHEDLSCHASGDGSIRLNVTGGGMLYTYGWTFNAITIAGADSNTLEDLEAGNYVAIVSDTFGCTKNLSVIIDEPDPLETEMAITPPSPPTHDGFITVDASGGILPYSYIWNTGDTLEQTAYESNVTFIVTITDDNGCTAVDSVIVVNNEEIDILNALSVFPNPANTFLYISMENDRAFQPNIVLLDMNGRKVYQQKLNRATNHLHKINTKDLISGVYILHINSDDFSINIKKKVLIGH